MNDKLNARRLAAGSPELQGFLQMRSLTGLAAIAVVFGIVFLLMLVAPPQEGSPAAHVAAAAACQGGCTEGE